MRVYNIGDLVRNRAGAVGEVVAIEDGHHAVGFTHGTEKFVSDYGYSYEELSLVLSVNKQEEISRAIKWTQDKEDSQDNVVLTNWLNSL